MPPRVYLSRHETFSCAHRLSSPSLSPEENVALFGKCVHKHGHNYVLEVVVAGEVPPTTGMVMNLTTLKDIIQKNVLEVLDHRDLDVDVPFFHDHPSTTENLALFVWDRLVGCLPHGVLHEIRIHETQKNMVVYRGE